MSDDEFNALNDKTMDRVGVGTSVTCTCGNLTVGPVSGWKQASIKSECAQCGDVIEAVPA